MSEKSPKVRKTGGPKAVKKSEVKSPKSEVGSPKSEVKSDINENQSGIDIPQSKIKELTTDNSPLATKMEVHHHPRLDHNPKPWKEYVLEGLMIFLAVTMGYFAESLREHIVSKEKENKYVVGMVRDLKLDTAEATRMIVKEKELLSEINMALQIPTEQLRNLNKQDTFYYHFLKFFVFEQQFTRNDNTLVQLKNAGGFSIIEKDGVTDSIIAVSNNYDFLKANNDFYHNDFLRVEDFTGKVIKVPLLPVDNMGLPVLPKMLNNTEVFTQYDKPMLEEFYSLIKIEKIELNALPAIVQDYKNKATSLLRFLKKEYDLKDE